MPTKTVVITKGNKTQKGVGRGMTLSWAEFVSYWSNWILVGALITGVLATIGIVVSSNVKETFWEHERETAKERLSLNEIEVARANESAINAQLSLEKERVERLKLEARVAPRSITQVQQNELTKKLAGLSKQTGTIFASPSMPESEMLARTLAVPMREAGWDITPVNGTPTATILFPAGIVIQYDAGSTNTIQASESTLSGIAALALAKALKDIRLDATAIPMPDQLMPPNMSMQIVIGPK